MATWSHSKTVRGFLAIIFCIFKQIGYHMSSALKSAILRQLNSRTLDALARCFVKTQFLKQIIQTCQLSAIFCKLFT